MNIYGFEIYSSGGLKYSIKATVQNKMLNRIMKTANVTFAIVFIQIARSIIIMSIN